MKRSRIPIDQPSREFLLDIKIEPLEEGGYLATSDELQGLLVQGRTVAEVIEFAQDAAAKLVESYLEHGDPLPPRIQRALRSARRKRAKVQIGVAVAEEIAPR